MLAKSRVKMIFNQHVPGGVSLGSVSLGRGAIPWGHSLGGVSVEAVSLGDIFLGGRGR